MKRAVIVGAAAAAFMSVSLYAQGRNFSGTWTIDSEKTTAANADLAGGRARSGGGGGTVERRVVDPATAGAVAAGGGGRGGGGGGTMVARSAAGGGAVAAGPVGTTITLDTKSFSVT